MVGRDRRRAVVVGGPEAAAAVPGGALLPVRPALVLGDGLPAAVAPAARRRSAVEPELSDRPRLFLFDGHLEIVELPEIAVFKEVRCT